MGLRERIKHAKDDVELNTLLKESASYTLSSLSTQRAWKSTARRRLLELSRSVDSVTTETPSKKNKTKK